MFELPNPLHPAIVHVPIVLAFLGALFAFVSIFTRRLWLPLYTAIILVLAAVGAKLATVAGDAQESLFSTLTSEQKDLVEEHSQWGDNVLIALIVAAVLSLIALGLHRFGIRRIMAILTTLAALVACFFVLRAAQLGGHLVYQHGIGVQNVPAAEASPAASPGASPSASQAASATPTAQ
jgi:uncharacterized membrane protein